MIHKSVVRSIGLDNIPVIDNSLMAATNVILQKATAVKIMGHYLLLLIFPHPLSSDYSFNAIPIVTRLGDAAFLAALAVHVFLFIYALKKFREKHLLSFCILFYFVSMSIASNIFMIIGTHLAERLLFLPSIAFCLALSYMICQLFKIKILETAALFKTFYQTSRPYVLIMGVLLVLFALKTTARNKDWKSNGTLFEKDIETVPNSAHMLMYYTDYLINDDSLKTLSAENKQARLLKAKNYIQKALKIYELFPDAHYLSGRIFYDVKDYESAYKEFNRAMTLNSGIAKY
jgi:tetratricopeptide (TPR) repeat protein